MLHHYQLMIFGLGKQDLMYVRKVSFQIRETLSAQTGVSLRKDLHLNEKFRKSGKCRP
jgi:hypothetical protein